MATKAPNVFIRLFKSLHKINQTKPIEKLTAIEV